MKRAFCTEATLYSGTDGLLSNTFWGSKRRRWHGDGPALQPPSPWFLRARGAPG